MAKVRRPYSPMAVEAAEAERDEALNIIVDLMGGTGR